MYSDRGDESDKDRSDLSQVGADYAQPPPVHKTGAAPPVPSLSNGTTKLGADDHLRAVTAQCPPQALLAVQIGIGGVEEGDARFEGGVDYGLHLVRVHPEAEIIGPETHHRNLEGSDPPGVHGRRSTTSPPPRPSDASAWSPAALDTGGPEPLPGARTAKTRDMIPLAIHHVSINVPDVEAAVTFYTAVLGGTVRADRPDLGVDGAWIDFGPQQVHLVEAPVPGTWDSTSPSGSATSKPRWMSCARWGSRWVTR